MRHSRSAAYGDALRTIASGTSDRRWTDDASDPNDAAAVGRRAEILRQAWRPAITDRLQFLVDRCADRRVLDIGCVAHDIARLQSPQWLHRRIARSAHTCVGVDIHSEGVAEMQRLGFTAVVHDLSGGLGPLAPLAPFDIIVAGELIEHVEDVSMLFLIASASLADDGALIITTPNPYAPHRVRAGQLGLIWENVDHILYAFPSGVAELAERHGLMLSEATTTDDRRAARSTVQCLKAVRRRIRGRRWINVGFTSIGDRKIARITFDRLGSALRGASWPRRRFVGETFVYVVRRPQGALKPT